MLQNDFSIVHDLKDHDANAEHLGFGWVPPEAVWHFVVQDKLEWFSHDPLNFLLLPLHLLSNPWTQPPLLLLYLLLVLLLLNLYLPLRLKGYLSIGDLCMFSKGNGLESVGIVEGKRGLFYFLFGLFNCRCFSRFIRLIMFLRLIWDCFFGWFGLSMRLFVVDDYRLHLMSFRSLILLNSGCNSNAA